MNILEKVPWISKDEWEYCRDNLFGENLFMKKKALEHLYIWKVRCVNLPIAIECTLILMDVHLKGCDKNDNNDEMFTNTMNYESWYSVAIMRFLNLITDSNVGIKTSSSMNQLARQYEIPEWIVEIRHAIAHGPLLPSLSSLKEAVEKCLSWLYGSYWSRNVYEDWTLNHNEDSSSSTFLCFEVCLFVKKYLLFGFENILNIPVLDRQKVFRVLLKNVDDEMEHTIERWSLVEVYKCALKKLGRHLKKNTDYGKNLISSILETNEYLLSSDALENNEISRNHFNIWRDILFIICDSSICYHFLQKLANIVILPFENSCKQHCAAIYLNEILKNIVEWRKVNLRIENVENHSVKRKKIKKKSSINTEQGINDTDHILMLNDVKLTEEELWRITHTVLNNPNQFVKIFLKNLLYISNSRKQQLNYDKLISLIDIYIGSRVNKNSDMETNGNSHSLQELIGESYPSLSEFIDQEVPNKMITKYNDVENIKINENNEWKNTPLGILPWQIQFQPWLHIYNFD